MKDSDLSETNIMFAATIRRMFDKLGELSRKYYITIYIPVEQNLIKN